eukprot:TRINITY_DN1371_c0_g2_i1.p1 TRINITY_DN1371_c0_g2~~TRINITY_DN1371_c0_g2_i1.p1  ORF type:complete len:187 (-),score=43.72 TRINITY_DN1371_c0_g2_i1:201-761(-)
MSSLTIKGKASEQTPVASSNSMATITSQETRSKISGSNSSENFETKFSTAPDRTDQPPSPTSTDGWGEIDENGINEESDKDGWDDIEVAEEKKPTSALANIQAAQQRPITQTRTQVTTTVSSRVQNKATKGSDDDLWSGIAVSPPKTRVKPIASATASRPASGRGRGTKATPMKLGAQRINRNSDL